MSPSPCSWQDSIARSRSDESPTILIGGLLANRPINTILNVIVNIVRPIPGFSGSGVIEAAEAMGAGPWRIVRTVLVPEALEISVCGEQPANS